MENLLTSSHPVSLSTVGPNAEIRLSALICLMQDIASNHASILGVGYEDLLRINRAFILSRLQIRMDYPLPILESSLEIDTWPRLLDRLFAYRDFEIRNNDGRSFLKGTTAWLLIDTEKRRPARAHAELLSLTPRKVCVLDQDGPQKLTWENNTETLDTRQARASDLDPNSHVNNTRYIDWITDAIAQKYGSSAQITELCVNFLSEIKLGQQVDIGIKELEDGNVVVQGEADRRNFCARVRLRSPR